MATRRPKVPKVAPSRPAQEASDAAAAQGTDVIGALRSRQGRRTVTLRRAAGHRQQAGPAARLEAAADRKQPGSRQDCRGRHAGPASLPEVRPRARRSPEADHQPVPAKAFSGRMLALAVVMIAITIMLAPTVKVFFDKKAEIDALNADIAARQADRDGPPPAGLAVAGPQLREAAGPRPH